MAKQLLSILLFVFSLYSINCSVVELTDQTFDSVLKEKKKGLVMFYSPGCGHCQRLKPTYEQLSNKKEIKENGILIARVDCTQAGKSTCGKYSIRGYPTVKFITKDGSTDSHEDYEGNRELNDLTKFVLDNSLPAIREVSESDVMEFISSDTSPVVMGIFSDKKSPLFEKLTKYSTSHRKNFQFGYTFSKEVANKLEKKMDCVVVYRQQLYKSTLDSDSLVTDSASTLEKFLDENKFSLVEIRTPSNENDFKGKIVVAFVAFDPLLSKSKFKRIRNAMLRVAKDNSELKFLISKKDDYLEFVNSFEKTPSERDIHLVAYDDNGDKYVNNITSSYEDIKGFESSLTSFIANFLKGGVYQRFIKSEPVPTSDTGFVKTVVATTFDSIVLDDTKDVFIEFYAPWCGHCKKLAPIYEKLAETLSKEDSLVIAKIDATANEVHKDFSVHGFPTIFLAKAGNKKKPVQYNGERTVSAMLEWLKKEVTHPIKFDGTIPEAKEEL